MKIIHRSFSSPILQMPYDLSLLEYAAQSGEVILLLYSWSRPVLSIGRTQKLRESVDLARCLYDNIPVVVRPSGGRAVLHGGDLCYCLAIPPQYVSRVGKNVIEAVCGISAVLARSVQRLFPQCCTTVCESSVPAGHSRICALSRSVGEVSVSGKKLISSAQMRGEKGLLQQGSIPLDPQYRRVVEYMHLSEEEKAHLRAVLSRESCSLSEIQGDGVSVETLMRSLGESFCAWGETLGDNQRKKFYS